MKLNNINKQLKQFRKEMIDREFIEKNINANPFEQFLIWFEGALQFEKNDPTAVTLATVDEHHWPDTRVVLLKELEFNQFIFYSSYSGKKASDINQNNVVALNFYWPEFSRQVRARGIVEKVERVRSENYFASRPRETQLCTYAWQQSAVVKDRLELDENLKLTTEKFANKQINCPDNWGGYSVTPFEYEFFQGRRARTHDRIFYFLQENEWQFKRLAP